METVYIPRGDYHIGQVITINGEKMRVESYSHTGDRVVVTTLQNAPKFLRITCKTNKG